MSHAKLFFELEGVGPYITPPTPDVMPLWLNEDKFKYTQTFGGHDPPPHKMGKSYGFVDEHGHAIDHTTILCE